MKPTLFALSAAAVASLYGAFPGYAQKADPAAVEQHIAIATAAAGSDMLGPLTLCRPASPTRGQSFFENYRAMLREPPLEPMQVMDQLYFVGAKWTTAWAVKTSAG